MRIPPPRILYTDVCGGQILGYTEDDMRMVAGTKAQISLDLTPRQRQTVEAMITHGTLKGAAKALGVQENSVKKALQGAREKAGASSTLQLCIAYVTGGPVSFDVERSKRRIVIPIKEERHGS